MDWPQDRISGVFPLFIQGSEKDYKKGDISHKAVWKGTGDKADKGKWTKWIVNTYHYFISKSK